MGGKALNSIGIRARRIESREEFDLLSREACEYLQQFYRLVRVCPEVSWKTSFGDIDVLVADIEKPFTPEHSVKNGYILSFEFKGVQVDVISVPVSALDLAYTLSFGDLNAIISYIFKRLNIVVTFRGAHLRVQHSQVLLTYDADAIFRFIGICDMDALLNVTCHQELFEQVITPTVMRILALPYNYVHKRPRRPDRLMFTEFKAFTKTFVNVSTESGIVDEEFSVKKIVDYFGADANYQIALKKYAFDEAFRQKFNGTLVARLTGLQGVQLGDFIKAFLSNNTREEIVEMTDELLVGAISKCVTG